MFSSNKKKTDDDPYSNEGKPKPATFTDILGELN
jgi:hypothetical protein